MMEDGGKLAERQLFPPPPPYYSKAGQGLQPPPLIEGTYQQFGELFTTEDGMPALQVTREFEVGDNENIDIKGQLLVLHEKLSHSIFELLRVLVEDPSAYARYVEHVGLLFRNMQYLINMLRPVQARVSLKDTLEADIAAKKKVLEEASRVLALQQDIISSACEEVVGMT